MVSFGQSYLYDVDHRESDQDYVFVDRKRQQTDDILASVVGENAAQQIRHTYGEIQDFVYDTRDSRTALVFWWPQQVVLWYNHITQTYDEILTLDDNLVISDIATTKEKVAITMIDRLERLSVLEYNGSQRNKKWDIGFTLVRGDAHIAYRYNDIPTILFNDPAHQGVSSLFFDNTWQYVDTPWFIQGMYDIGLYANKEWVLYMHYIDAWWAGGIQILQQATRSTLSPFAQQNLLFDDVLFGADSVGNAVFVGYRETSSHGFVLIDQRSYRQLPVLAQHTESYKNISDINGRAYPGDMISIDIAYESLQSQNTSTTLTEYRTLTTTANDKGHRSVTLPTTQEGLYHITMRSWQQWVMRKGSRYAYFAIDRTLPVLSNGYDFGYNNKDNVLVYSFGSTEYGVIDVHGKCAPYFSSNNSSLVDVSSLQWVNEIWLWYMPDGLYTDCQVTVTDAAWNTSSPLAINTFSIKR